jgi:Fe-S-cluster containining protein
MKLKVLEPWYAQGLKFTCQQCGNCCTGAPGYVWISDVEIGRLAAFLKLTEREVIRQYCRKVGQRYTLKEIRNSAGQYDCVFLKEEKAQKPRLKFGDEVVHHTRRTCSVYSVRPLQCRTWPFWDSLLSSEEAWNEAGKRCHGINHGKRVFSKEEAEKLKDAEDWPQRPPTSGQTK